MSTLTAGRMATFLYRVGHGPEDRCWPWKGGKCAFTGYGRFGAKWAHRAAFDVFRGESIPGDLQADHTCFVRDCVNPTHLEAVTGAENVRRALARHTSPYCPQGHSYTPENTGFATDESGYRCRRCRTCAREKQLVRSRSPEGKAKFKAYRKRPDVLAKHRERERMRSQRNRLLRDARAA